MQAIEYGQKLAYYHKLAEDILPDMIPLEAPGPLREAMEYSLLGGGKRIRAVLLLAVYEYCGGKHVESALAFAAAVEMIHAYSLIHDDLPCMDDDDMRRGKPSCHIAYGESTAILAGDALLTLAFETISTDKCMDAFGAEKIAAAVNALAKAAGACGMVAGQILDLENEEAQITADQLTAINRLKTGALIRACAKIGCILAGAEPGKREAARQYAANIGLAFQVVDDVLDKTVSAEELGKPAGSDEKNAKTTYAKLLGTKRAAQLAQELTNAAVTAIKNTDGDSTFLAGFAAALCDRKS
ncbi:MAG: polyprenyl synthetase family protein [Oscillospiraceae bacterium]|nr:polyprenyl synthetase family protein [Oscillospiraceae bacterium]